MSEFVSVGRKSWFYPGMIRACNVGGRDVAVVNVDGEFHAFSNACTHMGVPLSKGYVEDGERIVCSLHHALFDLHDGKVIAGPAYENLEVYEVRVDGDEVLVAMQRRDENKRRGLLKWIS